MSSKAGGGGGGRESKQKIFIGKSFQVIDCWLVLLFFGFYPDF